MRRANCNGRVRWIQITMNELLKEPSKFAIKSRAGTLSFLMAFPAVQAHTMPLELNIVVVENE